MGWEFAAVGVVGVILSGVVFAIVRAVRRGNAAQPKLDIAEAINQDLKAQAKRHQDPLPPDSEWERLAAERMSDPDSAA